MYNLSVAVAQTFYVGEGQWLVHNCDLANDPWFQKVEAALRKQGVNVQYDPDTAAYLKRRGAEASFLGDFNTILLRPEASRSAIFEELIHLGQSRSGRFSDETIDIIEREILKDIEAKEKLIVNRQAYGIPNRETSETIKQLREYRRELERLRR